VCVGLSYHAPLTKLKTYLTNTLAPDRPVCFALGAMAHGDDDFADDWIDAKIAMSGYSLFANAIYILFSFSTH